MNDSGIQWTAEAKEAFCKDMETIMEIAVDKVEQTREKTNGKKRINVVNVRDAMFSLVTTLIRGEKNE